MEIGLEGGLKWLGRGITGDDKGCENTVCKVDRCEPKL